MASHVFDLETGAYLGAPEGDDPLATIGRTPADAFIVEAAPLKRGIAFDEVSASDDHRRLVLPEIPTIVPLSPASLTLAVMALLRTSTSTDPLIVRLQAQLPEDTTKLRSVRAEVRTTAELGQIKSIVAAVEAGEIGLVAPAEEVKP